MRYRQVLRECPLTINPLYTGLPPLNPLIQMGTLVNSEDTDEMQHDAAFHQGLHCCKEKQVSGTEI